MPILTLWQRRFAFPVHINVDTWGCVAKRTARTSRYTHVEMGTRTTSLKQDVVIFVGPGDVSARVETGGWTRSTHQSPRRGFYRATTLDFGVVESGYMVFRGYMKANKVHLAF
jgi:hypothetical protein